MSKLADSIFARTDWYVTSPFGSRIHPISGAYSYHYGTDYGTDCSEWPQYAIEDGYILSTGSSSGYGNFVWVRYPRIGKALFHAHLSEISVSDNQTVQKGTLIGYTGTTGYSTGIHLHLGMQPIGENTWEDPHSYNYEPISPQSPTCKDVTHDQIYINADELNIRTKPNTESEIISTAKKDSFYNYYDVKTSPTYTWYKITTDQWVANDGNYISVYPKEEIVSPTKADSIKNQVLINVSELRIRTSPSLSSPIFASYALQNSYYDYYDTISDDDYTWYKIGENQWIANDSTGSYLSVLNAKYSFTYLAESSGTYIISLLSNETVFITLGSSTEFRYKVPKSGKYKIKLKKGERLYVA